MDNNPHKKSKCSPCLNPLKNIYSFLYSFIILFAIYLSFKCNQRFNFGSFLLALFFSPFYILYVIVIKKFCNT